MTSTIDIMLNGEALKLADIQPDMTLLNWLRLDRFKTGTKEGCAEGDCGACTVAVSRINKQGELECRAVNACILLLPMLDGSSITTVEGVAGPDGDLHPVQQAMINFHGAQCGFCTPGFVMSLYAHWQADGEWIEAEIEDGLAGNLCRCTGYGPIVQAGLSLLEQSEPEWGGARRQAEVKFLQAQDKRTDYLQIETERQSFYAPRSLDELYALTKRYKQAQILAGATDIGLWITKQHRQIEQFIHLGQVKELAEVSQTETGYEIGAAVTHNQAIQALLQMPVHLMEVWRRFGSVQVRNSGMVCANIANGSPIGDLAPCFLALGAKLTLNQFGERRQLAIEDFFIDYGKQNRQQGEFLHSIHLPKLGGDEYFYAYKISKRFDQDISAVLMALWFQVKDNRMIKIRLAFGGMAGIPKRAVKTEKMLEGHILSSQPDERVIQCLAGEFTPLSDMRASADYRRDVAVNLLKKAFIEHKSGQLIGLAGAALHDRVNAPCAVPLAAIASEV